MEDFSKLRDMHILGLKEPSTTSENQPIKAHHHGISEHQTTTEKKKRGREEERPTETNPKKLRKW